MTTNRAGCNSCCGACCATEGVLAADVSIGSLPTIEEVLIDVIANCRGVTSGVRYAGEPEEVEHSGSGFVHPDDTVPGTPFFGFNVLVDGKWSLQIYDAVGFIRIMGYPAECYIIPGTTLLMQITPVSGSIGIVLGNEPEKIPYWVRLEYWIYTEEATGDCILRVGAMLIGEDHNYYFQANANSVINGVTGAGGTTVPYTLVNPVKYSDYNPCGEDMGLLPGVSELGQWVLGRTFELEDFGIKPLLMPSGSGTNGVYDGSELTQADDPVYLPTPDTSGQYGFVWEINLSDSSITDLADLPETTLDMTNVAGIYTGNIREDFTAVGDLPADWLDSYIWTHFVTGGLTQTGAGLSQHPDYEVLNDGAGGHICDTTIPAPDPCQVNFGVGTDGYGAIQADTIKWQYEYGYTTATQVHELADLVIVLKQPTPP